MTPDPVKLVSKLDAYLFARPFANFNWDRASMSEKTFASREDKPAIYRIRFSEALDESWSDMVGGMAICVSREKGEAPVTTLEGRLIDQAALSGVLNFLHEMGFTLLSVEYVAES
jgi:hypothetical protein